MDQKQPIISTTPSNREYKSSAFTTYYSVPQNAADLYRALSKKETIQPEDIEYTTLEGVIFMARKNDLAFTAENKVLVIGEHQSTLNLNMPLRSAIYYGRTMERLIPPRDIYKTNRIFIPTPEFYVFYNGTKDQPGERILKLSDSYLEKTDFPMLELNVKMININPSANHPLLKQCRTIYEYATFIQRIRDYIDQGEHRTSAITEAMKDCLNSGIMVDFIQKHGSEVVNMLFTEFNMEDALEVRGEERYAEGKAEGKADVICIIRRKLASGVSIQSLAEFLELEESYIAQIDTLCKEYPAETDVQIAQRLLK